MGSKKPSDFFNIFPDEKSELNFVDTPHIIADIFYEIFYKIAEDLYLSGDKKKKEEARRIFIEILERIESSAEYLGYPQSYIPTLFRLAEIYFVGFGDVECDLNKAEGYCRTILSLAETNTNALCLLGEITHKKRLIETGEESELHEEAMRYFQRALEIDPYCEQALLCLGGIYYNCHDLKKALNFWKQLLNINPKHAAALSGVGLVFLQHHNFEEAAKYFKRALKSDRENPDIDALYGLGEIDRMEERFPEAIEKYRKVLERDPDCQEALFSIGRAYYHGIGIEENDKDAFRFLNQFVTLYEKDKKVSKNCYIEALYILGEIYAACEDEKSGKAAVYYFRKILKKDRKHAGALYWMGELYYTGHGTKKNKERAFNFFRKAYKADPEDIETLFRLGKFFYFGASFDSGRILERNPVKARRYLERVKSLDVGYNSREVDDMLSSIETELKELEEAKSSAVEPKFR
ncbi:MAG: tetratricopeptide repeat protein [Gammaproteobacteria bacterium]|nr:tetratricopeptide repeat protein [Gammaproteobacteria bacterium]